MGKVAVFVYGLVSYLMFLGVFVYAIGFLGNVFVPKAIDSGPVGPLGISLAINIALLGAFAVQHSLMARPFFKDWLTRFIPQAAERSTYVLLSNVAMILLFWQWRPLGGTIWNVELPAAQFALFGLFATGWLIILGSTWLIDHFELFGLKQVWYNLRGKELAPIHFVTPGPYKYIRHPLYVGWITVFWATPSMTAAHLLFAVMTTVYILVAIQLEERDLVNALGRSYAQYKQKVPMLIPRVFSSQPKSVERATSDSTIA